MSNTVSKVLVIVAGFLVIGLLILGCDSTGAGGSGGDGDDIVTDPTTVRVTNLDTAAGERDLMILVAPDNYDLLDEFGVKGVEAVNDLHGMCFQTCNQDAGEVSIELQTLSGEPFAGANGQSYTLFFSYEEGDVPILIGSGSGETFEPFSHTFTGTGSPQMVNVALPDIPDYADLFEYIDTVQVEVTNITLPAWYESADPPDDEIWDLFVVVTESSVEVPGPDSFIAIAEKHEIGEYADEQIDVGPLLLADVNDIPWLPESGETYNIFVVIETRVWDLGGDQHSFYKSIAMDTVPGDYDPTLESTWPVVNPEDLGHDFDLFVVAGEPDYGKGGDALNTIDVTDKTFTWFAHGVSED